MPDDIRIAPAPAAFPIHALRIASPDDEARLLQDGYAPVEDGDAGGIRTYQRRDEARGMIEVVAILEFDNDGPWTHPGG